jgi:hypothetical protein
MRYFIILFAAGLLAMGCRKSKKAETPFTGVWVESSLRLDTLDFEAQNLMDLAGDYPLVSFQTNVYSDPVLNPNYLVSHSDHYSYYFTDNNSRINLRGMLSSSSYFNTYNFSLASGGQRFTVDKFYGRRSLPAVIEFVRIR